MSDWLRRIWGRDHSVGSSRLEPDERMCPGTGEVTNCMADCHPLGENCDGQASETVTVKGMLDVLGEAFTDEELPMVTKKLFLTDLEAKDLNVPLVELVERGGPAVRALIERLYSEGIPIQTMIQRLREDGYDADFLLTGRPAERRIIEGEVAEDVDLGDLLEVDSAGRFRRADHGRIVGVALGDGRVRLTAGGFVTQERGGMEMSWARENEYYGSMAYQASIIGGPGRGFPRAGGPARFQFNERFPKEVVDKAMKLLEKFMSPDQYEAFLRGDRIELENKAGDHRIMISRTGDFSILRGPRGAGIVMTSGRCRSYKYPLGDEIAAFLDWFNHRTEELIDRWKCGTFGIIEEGKER